MELKNGELMVVWYAELGNVCFCWFGTMPRLIIAKAELMRLILNDNSGHFKKPPLNPLVDLLTMGLSTLEGEKWAKRRRLITPAFHHEKLQVISLPIPSSSVLLSSINYLLELSFRSIRQLVDWFWYSFGSFCGCLL